jgi:hypothetical protein
MTAETTTAGTVQVNTRMDPELRERFRQACAAIAILRVTVDPVGTLAARRAT